MSGKSRALLDGVNQLRRYFDEGQMGPYDAAHALIRKLEEVAQFERYAQMSLEEFSKQPSNHLRASMDEVEACSELLTISAKWLADFYWMLHERRQINPQVEITKAVLDEVKLNAAVNILASKPNTKLRAVRVLRS